MYNAQPRINLDSLLGGILVLGGVAWTVMTLAFVPAPEPSAAAATNQTSQLSAAATPSTSFSGEATSTSSTAVEVIVDKKYA